MKYYKRVNDDTSVRTVEAYSHNGAVLGAVEITEKEFDDFIKSLPALPQQPSVIEQRLTALEQKVFGK